MSGVAGFKNRATWLVSLHYMEDYVEHCVERGEPSVIGEFETYVRDDFEQEIEPPIVRSLLKEFMPVIFEQIDWLELEEHVTEAWDAYGLTKEEYQYER